MTVSLFVTGTDTEIGKTFVSAALLRGFVREGLRATAMKPIAAGATLIDGVLHNEDADQLDAAASVLLPPEIRTPFLLKEPAAPHIAAALEGVTLDMARIVDCYEAACERADAIVVEGVGGFRVPLTATEDTADLAVALGLPVVLVVGMRLGCISHALLTAEAIAAREPASFDVVTCMEMLEHVPQPAEVVKACATLVKPGGWVFFSTLNRNVKSYLLAVIGAEYIAQMLPKGTHDYARFIRPSELAAFVRDAGMHVAEIKGITYNPLTRHFALSNDSSVNGLTLCSGTIFCLKRLLITELAGFRPFAFFVRII